MIDDDMSNKTLDLSKLSNYHKFLWYLGHIVRKNLVYGILRAFTELSPHGYILATVRVDNTVFRLYTHYEGLQVIDEVMLLGQYREALKLKPRVVVDLGAHIGTFTLLAVRQILDTYGDGLVVAVEPITVNYLALLNNIRLNRVERVVQPIKAAVAQEPRWVEIEWIESKEKVKAITMNELTDLIRENYDRIDLVKIDIEGAELEILTRNNRWLQYVNAIVMELHPRVYGYEGLKRIIEVLEKAGFAIKIVEHSTSTKTSLMAWIKNVQCPFIVAKLLLMLWKTGVALTIKKLNMAYWLAVKSEHR